MKNFEVTEKNDELWIVKILPGKSFDVIFEDILNFRDETGFQHQILAEFNTIKLSINKDSTLESLNDEYDSGLNKLSNTRSQEYKDYQKNEKLLGEKYNARGQQLLTQFDEALKSTSSLVKWLGEFSMITDSTNLDYKPKELAQKMKDKGFDYEPQKGLTYNKDTLGRDIIANAFISLSSGDNIHHVAETLASDYKSLEDKENILSKIEKKRETFNTPSINKTTKLL